MPSTILDAVTAAMIGLRMLGAPVSVPLLGLRRTKTPSAPADDVFPRQFLDGDTLKTSAGMGSAGHADSTLRKDVVG